MPTIPSSVAPPVTPRKDGTSNPWRCSAILRVNCSCPPCRASGIASSKAVRVAVGITPFLSSLSNPSSVTSPANFFPILAVNTARSKPNLAASAPNAPPKRILSIFSPPYSCASCAALLASASDTPELVSSWKTAS